MKTRFITLIAMAALTVLGIAKLREAPVQASVRTGATGPGSFATATFAGGCFWCMEPPFERLKGVVSVTSGYTGGETKNPTYEEVSGWGTGHFEAVEIAYDLRQITYPELLEVFWHNVDPTNDRGQFCDNGGQYRTGIFYHGDEQKRLAQASKLALQKNMKIVTGILPAGPFYPAEEYHQDYYTKNPLRYKFYRLNCGRDTRLEEIWGKAPTH